MFRRLSQQNDIRFPGIPLQNGKGRPNSICYPLVEGVMKGLENAYESLSAPPDVGLIEETTSVRFKVIVLGDEQCGKTSLLYSFSRKSYEANHPVVFEDDISTLRFGSKLVHLLLIDLSGLEDYDGFRCQLYKDTDLFIVCFDIGNPKTLENVQEVWIPEIAREEPGAPFILVGCKNDLRCDQDSDLLLALDQYDRGENIGENGNERGCNKGSTVAKQEAEKVGFEWGGREYIECCARTGYQTSEVFRVAAQLLLSHEEEKNQQSGGAFKGLTRFARRKSSDISGRFAGRQDAFLNSSKRTSRRKSLVMSDQPGKLGCSAVDSRLLNLSAQIPYNNKHRRSSAFA